MENTTSNRPVVRPQGSLTLRDMISPLFRNWRTVVATFAAVFFCAMLVAWVWARHYYVATMQVAIARERYEPAVTGQQNAAGDNLMMAVTEDEVTSEVALLQGRDMLEEVVRSCGLTAQRSMLKSMLGAPAPGAVVANDPAAVEAATQSLAGALRVEAQRMSHVIDVRYGHWGAPETSACVLQKLGNLYLEKHLRLQRPAGAFDFFEKETDKYQKELSDSEKRLVEFSRTEGVAAPELLRASMAQQLASAEASLDQTNQQIAAHRRRIENIETQLNQTPSRATTAETSLSANTLMEQLQASLLSSELKKTQLLMKYDPSYPLVQEVEVEIAKTKEAIVAAESARYLNTTTDRDPTFEYLREDRARTQADLAAEQATASALTATIRNIQLRVVNLDAKAIEQAALLRDAKANEGNYLLYLAKREQERTSDALDQKRIANVAIAVPVAVPALTAYSSSAIAFMGFWIALLAGIIAGYVREFANPSFRTPAEVEDTLKIAVLAAVPRRIA